MILLPPPPSPPPLPFRFSSLSPPFLPEYVVRIKYMSKVINKNSLLQIACIILKMSRLLLSVYMNNHFLNMTAMLFDS